MFGTVLSAAESVRQPPPFAGTWSLICWKDLMRGQFYRSHNGAARCARRPVRTCTFLPRMRRQTRLACTSSAIQISLILIVPSWKYYFTEKARKGAILIGILQYFTRADDREAGREDTSANMGGDRRRVMSIHFGNPSNTRSHPPFRSYVLFFTEIILYKWWN